MDFHSLSRRELQSLCMSNGIKANMTNLAMADALRSLQTVEGISETPRKAEPKTELPKAGRRAASSRHVGSARPHEPQGSPLPRSRRVTARFDSEILNSAATSDTTDEGKDEEWVVETPKAPATRTRAQGKKESTIPKTTTTRRRASKKEEERTVGVTTRRRTRMTLKKEDEEDLDVSISIRGKSALKMADLGKDVVEEANNQTVEEQSGSTEENEEEDIAQVLPIERSKEEEEEKDVIEDVLSNDSSTEEEEEETMEKKEITQVLPIEQPEEDTIPDEKFSFSEKEIDSKKEENCDEEKEQDDEDRGEVSSGENETYYQQEKLESSNELTQEEATQESPIKGQEEATEESPIKGLVTPFKQQQQDSVKEASEEEVRREGTDILLRLQQLSLSKSEVDEVSETVVGNKNLILEVGTVDFSAGRAAEEVDDGCGDFGIDIPVEIDFSAGNKNLILEVGTVDFSACNKNLILEVGTVDFSAGKASEEVDDGCGDVDIDIPVEINDSQVVVSSEIPVRTTEKFDLLPLSVSNNNDKENHTGGGDGRQKKFDPKAMSLRKLKSHIKESLIKVEEKRSALKRLEENLLTTTTSKEDAVM